MKEWIYRARTQGQTGRQAHCKLPAGSFEREIGREGFFGPATHMYHRHPPTGWSDWEGPLRPRAFNLLTLEEAATDPWGVAAELHNGACRLRLWACERSMTQLVRNADGDELLFVHRGSGDLYCDYGHLAIAEGDYLVLPRGTAWRLEVSEPLLLLMIEATGAAYQLPVKGVVGRQAIFDTAALDVPEIDQPFLDQQGEQPWQVLIKKQNQVSRVGFPYNPLDALGWHGDLFPVRLNWRDIRPLMSHRYHLPPSAHTTWVADRFVVCTFVPRPRESDPDALKLPFYHSNDDFDEVIFYHQGNFFSRDNIDAGMLTWHPGGFPHGPHPKAYAGAEAQAGKMTDEVAVMIDTRDPLECSPALTRCERTDYVDSWRSAP